jgi:hypothetical protein
MTRTDYVVNRCTAYYALSLYILLRDHSYGGYLMLSQSNLHTNKQHRKHTNDYETHIGYNNNIHSIYIIVILILNQ